MAECKDPKARIAVEIERAAKDALLDTSYDGWGPWEDSHNARGPLRLSRNASRIEMRCEQAVVLRARSETLADVLKGMPEQADRDRAEALRRAMSALDAAIRVPSAKE